MAVSYTHLDVYKRQKESNQKKNQRGNAIQAGRAEMLSGAVRLPAFAGTMDRRICAQTARGRLESFVCGGSAQAAIYRISEMCIRDRHSQPCRGNHPV